ncbi:S9 family peptidase [Aestuariibacter salexigens]|uniref:S9 family peptidase n=1 Tax=Aestuariibacter salexigens TaxID=226010 RepID=UPI00040B30E2|nr:S9 family peptidase [Aestuariibacter salexigens]
MKVLARVTAAVAATLLSAAVSAQQSEQHKYFTYNDVFQLEYAAAPQFHPDGTSLVYERRSMNIMNDRVNSNLWHLDLTDQQHRPLLTGSDSYRQARFSPDGSKLAYISNSDEGTQLFVRYMDTGVTAKLTNLQYAPSSLAWSNDGSQLAMTVFTPSKPETLFKDMPAKPDGANWAPTATYIERTRYRADGRGYLDAGFNQIYVLPVEGGTPRQVTFGDYPHGGAIAWSADDSALYYSANPSADYARQPLVSDIYRIDLSSGNTTQVTSLVGPESNPVLSPDGKYLAFRHTPDKKLAYQIGHLAVMPLDGGDVKLLTTSLDRNIGQFAWREDSRSLVFQYIDRGHSRLANVDLRGKISGMDLSLGGQSMGRPYTSGQFALSSRNDIVFTKHDPIAPADLELYSDGETRQLTRLNRDLLGHKRLADVGAMPVTSSVDERTIESWYALPPNAEQGKRYPLILEIHGGPHAAYGPQFSPEIQLMAQQGYIVVWANPRGSSSYGMEFGNTIHHNYPSEDYNDLMDVVDAAIEKLPVDKDNLFITGGSGGGVLTAWSIGKTNRFKAAVVAKPVINWMSFALTADAYPYFSQYWMPGMPWEIADHLWQHSPLSLVGNVTTPTLLLTGEADYRTPISESEQYYQALRLKGVDAGMVRIPGAPHGIAGRPSHLIQKVGNIIAWFERYKTR